LTSTFRRDLTTPLEVYDPDSLIGGSNPLLSFFKRLFILFIDPPEN